MNRRGRGEAAESRPRFALLARGALGPAAGPQARPHAGAGAGAGRDAGRTGKRPPLRPRPLCPSALARRCPGPGIKRRPPPGLLRPHGGAAAARRRQAGKRDGRAASGRGGPGPTRRGPALGRAPRRPGRGPGPLLTPVLARRSVA